MLKLRLAIAAALKETAAQYGVQHPAYMVPNFHELYIDMGATTGDADLMWKIKCEAEVKIIAIAAEHGKIVVNKTPMWLLVK